MENKHLKYFSGAGIILLEQINDIWYVILIKDHTGRFSDAGGMYDKHHKSLKDVAIQELREESRNLINITNPLVLTHYIDNHYKKNDTYYRSYIVNISGININDFYTNKLIIDSSVIASSCWKESTDIIRIKLKDLFNYNSIKIKIRTRLKQIIKTIGNINNMIKIIPKEINKKKLIISNKTNFLKNTKSWIIK